MFAFASEVVSRPIYVNGSGVISSMHYHDSKHLTAHNATAVKENSSPNDGYYIANVIFQFPENEGRKINVITLIFSINCFDHGIG